MGDTTRPQTVAANVHDCHMCEGPRTFGKFMTRMRSRKQRLAYGSGPFFRCLMVRDNLSGGRSNLGRLNGACLHRIERRLSSLLDSCGGIDLSVDPGLVQIYDLSD